MYIIYVQPFLSFFLSGKQDYKKTKSVLKATRLKAEAKKYSSGFRVRPAPTLLSVFLLGMTEVCSCTSPPRCRPGSANHPLSICLSACQFDILPLKNWLRRTPVDLVECLKICWRIQLYWQNSYTGECWALAPVKRPETFSRRIPANPLECVSINSSVVFLRFSTRRRSSARLLIQRTKRRYSVWQYVSLHHI